MTRLTVGAILAAAFVYAGIVGVRWIQATVQPGATVSPSITTQLWYRPTPFLVTVSLSHLSGPGQTPVSGYQYGLQWDPTVLKWLSGPAVGPGTPTPPPILPCGQQIVTWGTPTATPTDFVPTYTPTATNTPAAGTPTNTPTKTPTASMTPTPGGYIQVGCATISNATPLPNGVVGTYKFLPIATAAATSPLNLINVVLVDHNGNKVTPGPAISSGQANFPGCYDVNGDGSVDIVDLSLAASVFLSIQGDPNYVPEYDVNGDGSIDIVDLSLLASEFLFLC